MRVWTDYEGAAGERLSWILVWPLEQEPTPNNKMSLFALSKSFVAGDSARCGDKSQAIFPLPALFWV